MRLGRSLLIMASLYAACFVAEVILEYLGKVDSIGYGYTALVAALYAVVLMPVILILGWLIKRISRTLQP